MFCFRKKNEERVVSCCATKIVLVVNENFPVC